MNAFLDTLLNSICHRTGEHADVLPLCVRCSSVYAGVAMGLVFEAALRLFDRRGPGGLAYIVNALGLGLMGVVGLGGISGLFAVPLSIKVFTGLWFGSAVAFFAVSAIAYELGLAAGRTGGQAVAPYARTEILRRLARGAFLGLVAVSTCPLVAGWAWAVRWLGGMAWAGLVSAFLVVNFAFALVALRRVNCLPRRVAFSAGLGLALIAAEFATFVWWRLAWLG